MIKLTLGQLLEAKLPGALDRFLACGLTVKAWKANRKTAAAIADELKAFGTKREELLARFEAKQDGDALKFADDEKAKAFAAEWAALMAVELEQLPGERMAVDDIVTGALQQSDFPPLAPFFVEEPEEKPKA
jgi:hypothetical protein